MTLYIVRFIHGQQGYIKRPYLGASRQDQATLAKSRLQHYAKTLYIPLLINIAIQIPAGPPELAQSQIKSGEPGAKQINSRTTPSEGLKDFLTCLIPFRQAPAYRLVRLYYLDIEAQGASRLWHAHVRILL